MDTLLDAAPGTTLFRTLAKKSSSRMVANADRAISEPTPTRYKRMQPTELLKALLGIHARQKAATGDRVHVRLCVVKPDGTNAIQLWVNGRDSLR
ncbi:MAG: hypothetical protein ACRCTD_08770 [Beijerinckiaceae bacterium]